MKFRARRNESPEVTLTPLIDVVFLLLIFFMVTTTFVQERAMDVRLPEASAGREADEAVPASVTVLPDGSYRIGEAVIDAGAKERLREQLQHILADGPGDGLYVVADAEAPHQAVVTAMDVARQLGISRLSLATRQPDTE